MDGQVLEELTPRVLILEFPRHSGVDGVHCIYKLLTELLRYAV